MYRDIILNKNKLITNTGFKICQTCKNLKCKKLYWKNKNSFDGLVATCIDCKKIKSLSVSNEIINNPLYEKVCKKCKGLKNLELFSKNPKNKDGLMSYCKKCNLERVNIWKTNNKDIQKAYRRNYTAQRKIKDPLFKIVINVRGLINSSFNRACNGNYKKSEKTEEILGCTIPEFIEHLQSLFTEGMTLENHGQCIDCWHIDHRIPLSTAKTEEDIIKLNHYTNLQPLWSRDNLSKGGKIIN